MVDLIRLRKPFARQGIYAGLADQSLSLVRYRRTFSHDGKPIESGPSRSPSGL